MKYTIIVIIVLVGYFVMRHVLRVLHAGTLMRKIERAALGVRVATFSRLTKRYRGTYGENAETLATAITNELFSDITPVPSPAYDFLASNGDIVERELVALRDDKDLLVMIHATLSQEIGIRHAHGATADQISATFEKLKRYGLLIPIEEIQEGSFLNMAEEFFKNNTG